jgi:hypothetical protein
MQAVAKYCYLMGNVFSACFSTPSFNILGKHSNGKDQRYVKIQ